METNPEMSYGKKPLWQLILIYLIVGGLVYGGIYKYYYPKKDMVTQPTAMVEPSLGTAPNPSSSMTDGLKITLSDAGYTPATLTIKVGDTVTWTNDGSKPATVSSDPHPSHSIYPPLNLGTFKPGGTHSLKFDTAGTYGYHNHLNSSQTGTIIVK